MKNVFIKIKENGIIPVIKIDDANDAPFIAEALLAGGISIAEITFRTDAAENAILAIKKNIPEMTVGAGTVLTIKNANMAMNRGAEFIVAPGFNPVIVDYCMINGAVVVPGCSTPSEIELALERGIDVVKFFPAEQSGGLEKIKAMAAAYGGVKFIPTGGISLENLGAYISCDKILACGGSFMVKDTFIKNKEWRKITELSREAVNCVKEARNK